MTARNDVRNLGKTFRGVSAADDITVSFAPGGIHLDKVPPGAIYEAHVPGYAGFSSWLPGPAEKTSLQYRIKACALPVELGRLSVNGGQEDRKFDVALDQTAQAGGTMDKGANQ